MPKSEEYYLKSIDKTLKEILKELKGHRKNTPGELKAEVKIDSGQLQGLVVDNIEKQRRAQERFR